MGSLFAERIQQLQTVIINQIGIALIRGIPHLNPPPELLAGFTESDMKRKFPEKKARHDVECPICLQEAEYDENVVILQCKHEFHPSCIY